MFHQLPELVNRYLMPPDPVVIHYSINPAQVPPERPSAWDIEVKMEDTSLKNRIMVTVQSSKDSMADLTKLDDEVRFSLPPSDPIFSLTPKNVDCAVIAITT